VVLLAIWHKNVTRDHPELRDYLDHVLGTSHDARSRRVMVRSVHYAEHVYGEDCPIHRRVGSATTGLATDTDGPQGMEAVDVHIGRWSSTRPSTIPTATCSTCMSAPRSRGRGNPRRPCAALRAWHPPNRWPHRDQRPPDTRSRGPAQRDRSRDGRGERSRTRSSTHDRLIVLRLTGVRAARSGERLMPTLRSRRPPWSSGLGRLPFKEEIAGSNPAGGTS
jgi:hypothetical protein